MWEDLGEVIVVSGTSGEVSTFLRVFGERIETGWEHPTRCKERSKVGTPFPKGGLLLLLILRPCPSGLLSHSSWAGMRAHGPRWNSLDLRKVPCKIRLPSGPHSCLQSFAFDLNDITDLLEGLISASSHPSSLLFLQ